MHQTSPPGRVPSKLSALPSSPKRFAAPFSARTTRAPHTKAREDDAFRRAQADASDLDRVGVFIGARSLSRSAPTRSPSVRLGETERRVFVCDGHAWGVGEDVRRRGHHRRGGRPNALDRGPGKDTVGAVSLGGDRGRVRVPRVSPAPSHAKLQTRVEDVDATIFLSKPSTSTRRLDALGSRRARSLARASRSTRRAFARHRARPRKARPRSLPFPRIEPTTGLLGDGDVPAVVFRAFRCVVSFSRNPPFVTRETSPTRA